VQVEYPGYNFVGLILGPEGNTQKRLEEVSFIVFSVRCIYVCLVSA
jgi:hypothetical protein